MVTTTQVPIPELAPAAAPGAVPPSPDQMPVSGPVGLGQVLAWEVIAALLVVAAALRHHERCWAFVAVAVLGLLLTVPRWRDRWAYQWLLTGWRFFRMRRAGQVASTASPLSVLPVPLRGGAEAGIVQDDAGFAVVVAIEPYRPGQPAREQEPGLTTETLASLLELRDDVISAVQVVVHDDLPVGDGTRAAAAYRELGYRRVPRSRSTWIVLRHEPTSPEHAPGAAVNGPELYASLTRTLAGCGQRAADLLTDLGLTGRLLNAEAARGTLDMWAVSAGKPAPRNTADPGERPQRWQSWEDGTNGHVTFWLRTWPSGGLAQLHQALSGTPVLSSGSAVAVTRRRGRLALTATVRVTFQRDADLAEIKSTVAAAALSCGARLVAMDGDHLAGAAATLPAGRAPATAGRWVRCHYGFPDMPLSVGTGGLALGPGSDGELVVLPFFRSQGTRAAVIGDPELPRMLALRALASGARVQVVTSRPAGWARLRSAMHIAEDQMPIVKSGAQPPRDGSRMSPWMVIDDTDSPSVRSGPWRAAAAAVYRDLRTGSVSLPSLDAVVLRGITVAQASVLADAMSLPVPNAGALTNLSGHTVGVAMPGSVSFPEFVLTSAETAALSASLRGDERQ
jgi:type VII secretion protein EccE